MNVIYGGEWGGRLQNVQSDVFHHPFRSNFESPLTWTITSTVPKNVKTTTNLETSEQSMP